MGVFSAVEDDKLLVIGVEFLEELDISLKPLLTYMDVHCFNFLSKLLHFFSSSDMVSDCKKKLIELAQP